MKNILLKLLLLNFLFISPILLYSENKNYSVKKIPLSLTKNANAVLRFKDETFERTGLKNAEKKVRYAITILNKGGEKAGYFIEPYFKYMHVSNISAIIYDKNGKKIRKAKNEDIADIALEYNTALFSDMRAKLYIPEYNNYPYTIEYEFTVKYRSSFIIDDWKIYPHYDLSVEEETFTLITPDYDKELGVYYYVNDSTVLPEIRKKDKKIIYHLHVENLPAVHYEVFNENISERTPVVKFAPVSFSVAGYTGSYSSWTDYGKFIAKLNAGRDNIPQKTKDLLINMTRNIDNKREIVNMLYKYLQDKVRYVSIQKGIGGWQPIDAKSVDELSYGDCKALTNYMKSILKVVNIDSKYTLVHAGKNTPPLIPDFPSNQFNHAILCVPLDNDTVWLECTSQHFPSGYLGSFTDDRNVLIIDKEKGAKIVHTPIYNENYNVKTRFCNAVLASDGTCSMNIDTDFKGFFYDEKYYSIYTKTHDNQKKKLLEQLYFPTTDLKDFSYSETIDSLPVIHENISLNVLTYATKFENRLMFTAYLFSKENSYYLKHCKRKSPINIRRSYRTKDSVSIIIPEGYITGKLPEDIYLSSKFGNYYLKIEKQKNGIILTRIFTLFKGIYPSEDYPDLIDYYDKIKKYDLTKIVLIKSE
ncbi:MAG: hypothetical protein DRI94_05885 [Bacteroidetes bacterium]|nr:MAG: hypothetical protein DRI94_05885 [Bacteroidota bacterium]